MYRDKKISLVIPAYNEEKLIKPTLDNTPDIIDKIYVVDDCSPDNQNEVVLQCAHKDSRIELIKHETNKGPGAAIISGYLRSSKEGYDIAVVVGGDYQMPLDEVNIFLDPIIDGKADYSKGNRFLLSNFEDTLKKMPKTRLIGNWVITALTKIASGFYKTMDVVDGYTAISKRAIDTINWSNAWEKYGYPMDFLIRLNAYSFKIVDIPRTAIYLPGERQSQIKGLNYALKVSPMLIKNFFWRLKFKYMYIDFHPLIFFYYVSFILIPTGFISGMYLAFDKLFLGGHAITASRSILVALMLISGIQFLLFAMLFDMEEGK
jgi:glycosyltransferase involved in cell wall biosynthesis